MDFYVLTECELTVFREFFSSDVSARCSNKCPIECSNAIYDLTISSSDFPSYPYANALLQYGGLASRLPVTNTSDYETLKRSMLGVDIFYSELKYTLFTEVPIYQVLDLLSLIGFIYKFIKV